MTEPRAPKGEPKWNWYAEYRDSQRSLERTMASGWRRSARRGQVVAAILSIGVAAASIVGLSMGFKGPGIELRPSVEVQNIEERLNKIDGKLSSLENSARNVPNGQKTIEPDSAALMRIADRLDTVSAKVDDLDAAIVDNPGEAVSIILLRRDVQEIKKSNENTALAASREVDRVYDMTKWLFGLFLTMALSILTLAFTALSKSAPSESPPKNGEIGAIRARRFVHKPR